MADQFFSYESDLVSLIKSSKIILADKIPIAENGIFKKFENLKIAF